jgi:hypothetical protein
MAGIWRFNPDAGVHVTDAAAYAIAYRMLGPCWFWFNGTPAPMVKGDDAHALVKRWVEWREAYQSKRGSLLASIESFSKDSRP